MPMFWEINAVYMEQNYKQLSSAFFNVVSPLHIGFMSDYMVTKV